MSLVWQSWQSVLHWLAPGAVVLAALEQSDRSRASEDPGVQAQGTMPRIPRAAQ